MFDKSRPTREHDYEMRRGPRLACHRCEAFQVLIPHWRYIEGLSICAVSCSFRPSCLVALQVRAARRSFSAAFPFSLEFLGYDDDANIRASPSRRRNHIIWRASFRQYEQISKLPRAFSEAFSLLHFARRNAVASESRALFIRAVELPLSITTGNTMVMSKRPLLGTEVVNLYEQSNLLSMLCRAMQSIGLTASRLLQL